MRGAMIILIALAAGGCPGKGAKGFRHELVLRSMTSNDPSYIKATGNVTIKFKVTDPPSAEEQLEHELKKVALEPGPKAANNVTLWSETRCHAENDLQWQLVEVMGTMQTPNGQPRQRPDWGLDNKPNQPSTVTRNDKSLPRRGSRTPRAIRSEIWMHENKVTLIVDRVVHVCELTEEERPVTDGRPPPEEPVDDKPPPGEPIEQPIERPQ